MAVADCSRDIRETIGCPTVSGSLNSDGAVLEGHQSRPGTTVGTGGGATDDTSAPLVDDPTDLYDQCRYIVADRCLLAPNHGVTPSALPSATITLADIAQFRPDAAVDNMEPNGWAIAGLHTNFFATGGAHIKEGALLGQPASVRFTPVSWNWSYGDGTAASHPVPGATWAAQGIQEFDPTPTSHLYRQYGTYAIDLTVDYAAEYRFADGPWVAIAGAVTLPANRLLITVGDARTVLVQRECSVNPGGPGC